MIKHYGLVVLILVLLFLTGCTSSSEAKINVDNSGELSIKVTINYSTIEIAPGKREGFTLTWPGRGAMRVSMVYFPVGQPVRSQYKDLELNNGDVLDLSVGFAKN
ncbi:MAG: hypothetical protein E4H23_01810 [Chrysiogenales bacterium]|nr:hypothetical protein [Candidatus Aminicenantes bacterium]TFG80626.1 MAG: hypothetical protein E4H23_01810 [Chrysiogenales bacterium]